MGSLHEGAVHAHGVMGGQARFHAEVVVVFTVHDGRVDHACSVGGGDPISGQHRPCRG